MDLLSTLAQLSAPGYNRAIGMGDVVPYWGGQGQGSTVSNAGAATPGVAYDPNPQATQQMAGAMGTDSVLNNLSALTPILNQIIAQQQQASIPSGTATMTAQPLPQATPGASSADVAAQLAAAAPAPVTAVGGAPIAGAPVQMPDASTPSGVGDSGPGAGAPAGVGDAGGAAAGSGDAGGAPAGSGDAGAVGDGTAGGIGGTAAGGEGGPGTAGDAGVGDGGTGDGGGGGGGGGGGSSVICSELFRQGIMPFHIWAADERFGMLQTAEVKNGYRMWAQYVARGMRRSRLLTAIVAPIAMAWAHEMAYQMDAAKKGSVVGRCIMAVGRPLCQFLGRFA